METGRDQSDRSASPGTPDSADGGWGLKDAQSRFAFCPQKLQPCPHCHLRRPAPGTGTECVLAAESPPVCGNFFLQPQDGAKAAGPCCCEKGGPSPPSWALLKPRLRCGPQPREGFPAVTITPFVLPVSLPVASCHMLLERTRSIFIQLYIFL